MLIRIARFCLLVLLAFTLLLPVSSTAHVEAQSSSLNHSYLPMIVFSHPVYFRPGLYPFSDKCGSRELKIYGLDIGKLTECVSSVQINMDGTARFNFTWKIDIRPGIDQCVTKDSDIHNFEMYVRDNTGEYYQAIDAGGAAGGIDCMEDNKMYEGWFLFKPASSPAVTGYTFFDDDNGFQMGPLNLPKNPNP